MENGTLVLQLLYCIFTKAKIEGLLLFLCGYLSFIVGESSSNYHSKNGRVVFATVWLYQFHLRDSLLYQHNYTCNQSSSLWRSVHAFTIISHVL